MQDFQPIPGLSGRIFGGSDVRRIRNYPSASLSSAQNQQPPPPTKCPRCESTNTKFCYYNNYNLSQPRHFCKSCRRYWTKGGVLRNVPVGGGCRKNSKRGASSKSKPDKKSISKPDTAPSGSSSESSSTLTAAAAPNPNPDTIPEPPPPPILPEPSDSFTGLMAGTDGLGFNFADPSLLPGFRVEEPEKEAAAADPTAGGLHVMDWVVGGGSADSGSLFDITSSVDPSAYWNQTHWGDADPSLYLP